MLKDIERAQRIASRLTSGGEKVSGLGRYHGDIGLQTFCYQTSVIVDKGKRHKEVNWFPYKDKLPLFYRLVRSYFGKIVYRFAEEIIMVILEKVLYALCFSTRFDSFLR